MSALPLIIPSGVVLLDKHQGFWLVHSTPHFPAALKEGQYFYPNSGLVNGQNFLCVTYPLEHFQTIGKAGVVHLVCEVFSQISCLPLFHTVI